MGATSYPGMTQPFSMGHTSNMSSVGVRQDSMGEFISNILTRNALRRAESRRLNIKLYYRTSYP